MTLKAFNTVGHFFAALFQKVATEAPRIADGINKVDATEGVVEAVENKIPVYGPLALTPTKAAFAVLGEIAALLQVGGDAAKKKLADAGIDNKVLDTAEALASATVTLKHAVQVATK